MTLSGLGDANRSKEDHKLTCQRLKNLTALKNKE
jgi:hypothetical protein